MRFGRLFCAGVSTMFSAVAILSLAQGPGGPGGPPPPGAQGGFQGGQFGRPGYSGQTTQSAQGRHGGQPGMAMNVPFISGVITGGNLQNGAITIQSQFGGSQIIRVSNATQVVSQVSIAVSDVKVGDQIQIQGVPTAITASSLTVGTLPSFLPGNGGPMGMARGQGIAANQSMNQQAAIAMARGSVSSISPLTISLSSDISVVLKLASSARVSRVTNSTLSALKVGDRIMASGQMAMDGSFAATGIGINFDGMGQ